MIHIESFKKFAFEKLNYSKIIVLVDQNTAKHCYPLLKPLLPAHELIEIESGEKNKNLRTCEKIWQKLTDFQTDRNALMINLGGGVIGDMGGFCAATFKRGIDFIQIPTTLLSQVDASVGGKLGIDFQGFKNHIGVFQLPKNVIIDTVFLQTLPANELRSGFAEVIKHCLITDKKEWKKISKKELKDLNLQKIVAHSVGIKEKVVTEDPTEKGLRKILNFGHTVGHAVEGFYLETPQKLLHGEAIAVGMIAESWISLKKGLISKKKLAEIENYIFQIFPKIDFSAQDIPNITPLALQDKKNSGKKIKASLLTDIGVCDYDIEISEQEIAESLLYYLAQ